MVSCPNDGIPFGCSCPPGIKPIWSSDAIEYCCQWSFDGESMINIGHYSVICQTEILAVRLTLQSRPQHSGYYDAIQRNMSLKSHC